MHPVDIVALMALLQLFVFAALVGRARGKYGVMAPAVSGHEMIATGPTGAVVAAS